MRSVSPDEYASAFSTPVETETRLSARKGEALRQALDIRKFEIQLYWTRSAYFWAFIALALAAYGGVQTRDYAAKTDLSVALACLGLVFSVAWFLGNRGSKQWQENWENHVDLLEDDICGPLYKTVLRRRPAKPWPKEVLEYITGPGPYSVSKINQLLSLYIVGLWIALLIHALPMERGGDVVGRYIVWMVLAFAAILLMGLAARTHFGDHTPVALQRATKVFQEESATRSVPKDTAADRAG